MIGRASFVSEDKIGPFIRSIFFCILIIPPRKNSNDIGEKKIILAFYQAWVMILSQNLPTMIPWMRKERYRSNRKKYQKIKKKIESETENMRKGGQKSSEKVLKMVDTHGSV